MEAAGIVLIVFLVLSVLFGAYWSISTILIEVARLHPDYHELAWAIIVFFIIFGGGFRSSGK
jgi:hypothetical protein